MKSLGPSCTKFAIQDLFSGCESFMSQSQFMPLFYLTSSRYSESYGSNSDR